MNPSLPLEPETFLFEVSGRITGEKFINVRELAQFISLFRAAYAYGTRLPNVSTEYLRENSSKIVRRIETEFARIPSSQLISDLFFTDLGQNELYVRDLSHESPLRGAFVGLAAALTLAVIISGGEIDISTQRVKVSLPPLGAGIESLQKAFHIYAYPRAESRSAASVSPRIYDVIPEVPNEP